MSGEAGISFAEVMIAVLLIAIAFLILSWTDKKIVQLARYSYAAAVSSGYTAVAKTASIDNIRVHGFLYIPPVRGCFIGHRNVGRERPHRYRQWQRHGVL